MEELGRPAVSLHSHKSQSRRLSALHNFKSCQVPVLLATDVASRGLDIQTVDLVINYDIPRCLRLALYANAIVGIPSQHILINVNI